MLPPAPGPSGCLVVVLVLLLVLEVALSGQSAGSCTGSATQIRQEVGEWYPLNADNMPSVLVYAGKICAGRLKG